jgi:hypothetical protein
MSDPLEKPSKALPSVRPFAFLVAKGPMPRNKRMQGIYRLDEERKLKPAQAARPSMARLVTVRAVPMKF